MSDRPKVQSPAVIAFAEKHNVDLATVRASSADGRITQSDTFRQALLDRTGLAQDATNEEIVAGVVAIMHTAKQRDARAAAAAAARAEQQSMPIAGNVLSARVAGRGPGFALNPLVDKVRAEASAAGRVAPAASSAPTLFAAGDLPTFTASGIPPESLLQVPWQARHAMAAAATPAEAYAIQADCDGSGGETNAPFYGDHQGNADYRYRVQQWQVASLSDEQVYNGLFAGADEEISRREAARSSTAISDAEGDVIDRFLSDNFGSGPSFGRG